jgi:hypothetical protein
LPFIATPFQFIVELAENFGGFDVDGLLFRESVLLVAGDERKGVDVLGSSASRNSVVSYRRPANSGKSRSVSGSRS